VRAVIVDDQAHVRILQHVGFDLRRAFDAAGLSAEIEVYKGANHGWVPPDSRAHHPQQAERAWQRKLALFSKALA
jgi:carboxymethylenebutenolidase